jgi:chromosome segregation ATPase
MIDEVRTRIESVRRSEEEYTRTFRLLDDGRRQDAKRLTDLQGELAALRKRVDEQRGRVELNSTSIKKVETRLNELATVENERREAQSSFLENQALKEVERDRVWKDWQARFDTIEGQTTDIEDHLQALDTTHRAVKRTQGSVEELAVKVERRINEITEIQRLGEERFRQEWVTFKADDQKRWTNYTLTLEEQRGESARQYDRLAERVTQMQDELQEVQDLLHTANEQAAKRLAVLLSTAHEWVTAYENSGGKDTLIASYRHRRACRSRQIHPGAGADRGPSRPPERRTRAGDDHRPGVRLVHLPGGEELGIIDVPGHRDFIENMLAGVGGIDAALFVVAADEGRHAADPRAPGDPGSAPDPGRGGGADQS